MRNKLYFSIILILGLVSAAALYAQTSLTSPFFFGQINIQVRPTGGSIYRSLEDWLSKQSQFPQVFSALATCAGGTEGTIAAVTDSTTVVWGATITGTGMNHVLAFCNGTNWTVLAK